MKRVGVSIALEKLLRAATQENAMESVQAVLQLLDGYAQAAGKPGLGYKELVTSFRDHLGAGLALPPNPSTTWIIRQVNRAKELGLDVDSIREIAERVREKYPRPPWDFEWLLRAAPRLLASDGGVAAPGGSRVTTGRGSQDD